MNTVSIVGRLTADPIIKDLGDIRIAKMRIAVRRRYKSKNGEVETDFFNVDAFGRLAELCGEWVSKGRSVGVTGELRQDSYVDHDGSKRSSVFIVANEVDFLGAPGEGGGARGTVSDLPRDESVDVPELKDEDLPF